MTRDMKEHVESQYHKVKEEIISRHEQLFPSSITLDGFLWAFGMLRSRAFFHLRGQLVMLPLVDLINHSASITREDNAEEINGPAGLFSWDLLFCLKSTMPVKEGEQVFIQYGLKKSNADLAFYYGFVEPNTNRNSYTLTFNISESDPFHREKLDIAAANDLGETAYLDIFMDRPLPPAILPYLRLVALQETDAFLLEPVYKKSIWKTLELPVSHVNEELVCKMVIDACESTLSGYRTTVEQDEKLIQEGNLGYKLEIAVRVRVGEKRVLQQIEGIVKEKEAQLDKLEYYHERRLKEPGLVGEEGETYCQPKKDSIPTL
ncbi:LOW QUALITY PROTEIN: ribulose-1,5 bisphosphate carboxylase/oxygenase large subunit N-methyltransferase, chloroplastic [Eucalyptus grandis]|uniref:LOW QUALITY PROTEIN: ribulose-1,5 bisphosphate carboxylase/oxygenase large subunit N-methyltransferase, chloroplastic n=1 Tax=Eucalyptus grandis TaxID=71139 RepID=UPI00192F049E|nr:LOW QUALITY PROTEIN: ribulose-1,5 bisphosphate carboxylase/oxygenase large subunit N-methyltransferase, chloroplastic [Eucalyptus grandis]